MYVCGKIKTMNKIHLTILSIGLFFLMACKARPREEKVVSVTIEPQRYFAEKIAGNKYKINTVVPVGQSPETYDPTPLQIIQIGESDAYLQIGYIGFEQTWMKKIKENNPALRIFNLSEGMNLLKNPEKDGKGSHEVEEATGTTSEAPHAHPEAPQAHAEGDHHHHPGGVDPHTWNSISGARIIAKNTLDAFVSLDKENEAYYQANYEKLTEEIDQTEKIIRQLLIPLQDRAFIIYHPALTYFAHEFDLTQLCIETDGKEPSPAQLKQLVETAKAVGARVVFVQQEFDQKNAELIAKETGCTLVVINPLDINWNKEMIHIAKSLADGKAN